MSGPKISVTTVSGVAYSLMTEGQKRNMALESLKVCIEKLEFKIKQISSYIELLLQYDYQSEECISLLTEMQQFVSKSKEMLEECKTVNKNTVSQKANEIAQKQINYYQTLDYTAAKFAKRVRRVKRYMQIESDYRLNISLSEGMQESFYIPFENIDNHYDNVKDEVNKYLSKINDFELSEELLSKYKIIENKSSNINDGEFLRNFLQMIIIPFVKDCENYNELYEKYFIKFEELKLNYEILCNQLSYSIQTKDFSMENIDFYSEQIKRMQTEIEQNNLQTYVNQSLTEAMEEMGYDLVGERSISSNTNRYKNELYKYSEGTVVSVMYGNDGQISMELGGIGQEDRLPTQNESLELVKSMEEFCNDYQVVEKKLKEKGIVLKHISLLPPDEQFAQIINVSEYNMIKDVENFEVISQENKIQLENYVEE